MIKRILNWVEMKRYGVVVETEGEEHQFIVKSVKIIDPQNLKDVPKILGYRVDMIRSIVSDEHGDIKEFYFYGKRVRVGITPIDSFQDHFYKSELTDKLRDIGKALKQIRSRSKIVQRRLHNV